MLENSVRRVVLGTNNLNLRHWIASKTVLEVA
jgi:hypothetical protein